MAQITLSDSLAHSLQLAADQRGISLDALVADMWANDQTSPNIWQQMIESTQVACVLTNPNLPDNPVVYVNTAFEHLTGYTLAETLGRNCRFLQGEGSDQATLKHIRDSIDRVETCSVRLLNYRKDGSAFWNQLYIAPIHNAQGELVYFVGFQSDVTQEVLLSQQKEAAQLELIESESRFRHMANYAPVMIWMADTTQRCTYFNQSWLDFTGKSIQAELGFGWADGVHPDDYDRCLDIYQTAFDQREPFKMDYRLRRHDGVYRWIRDEAAPRFAEDGTFMGYIGSCTDITHIKAASEELQIQVHRRTQELAAQVDQRAEAEVRLRRERDLLENVFRTSPASIFRISPTGRINFASRRAESLLGMRLEEIQQQHFNSPPWDARQVDGTPFPPGELPFERVVATGRPIYHQQVSIKRDGQQALLELNLAPLFDDQGEMLEVIITAADITLHKRWEAAMEQQLEAERQHNAMKTRFISLISHEFKTPLSIIQTSCDIVRMNYERLSPEQHLNRLERIVQQVQRLNNMIDEVTELNRTVSGAYDPHPEPLDLHQTIKRVVSDLQVAFQDAAPIQTFFEGDCGRRLLDPNLMHQIITNLVSNAIKYTPDGDPVEVYCTCTSSTTHFKVVDHGIGIPEAEQDRLAEMFFRASNVQSIKGTGLGLMIVKQAVRVQGGQLSIDSAEGAGTTVAVELPVRASIQSQSP